MANYTNVSFAGNALQTANIFVKNIQHFSIPAKNMPMFALAHDNKSAIPFTSYSSRIIEVDGVIQGSSIADLDSRLDTFKSWFTAQDQNLDIDYNGGTRRYIATLDPASSSIDRPGGLLYAEFSLQFVCTSPFGQDTGTSSLLSNNARTNASYTDAVTVLGTAPQQLPIFTLTYNNALTSASNLCTNPGFEVDLTGWANAGFGGTGTRTTSQFHSGVASLQFVNAGSLTGGYYGGMFYSLSGLTVGVTYTISYWLKGNAGGEIVSAWSTSGGVGSTPVNTTLTTGWQQVFYTFTANGVSASVNFYSTSPASGTWFLDDVSIVANSSAFVFMGNNSNGQGITVNRTWSTGDVMIIDCTQRIVTINGSNVVFTGAFPELAPGAQTLGYVDSFTSRSFNISVAQTPLYL